MNNRINLYTPLGAGGPTSWGRDLCKELNKHDFCVKQINTIGGYLLQPFNTASIVHSTIPFPRALFGKYILTIHGNYLIEKQLSSRLYPLAIRQANVVTVPTEFIKKAIGVEDAIVIPNGIYLPEKTKPSYKLHGKNPTYGILTNFNFREKAEGLIDLAKVLKQYSPQSELFVGGTGRFFEEFKSRINKIFPNTTYLGFCKKEELFEKIDVFTYYSHLDNQPIGLLEAMAYGMPIVSNNVGGVPEVLVENTEKYLAKSPDEYGKILTSLSDEASRKEAGKEARVRAADFDWNKVIEIWLDLYKGN